MNSENDKQTLTKADIVDQVFEKVGVTKRDATDVVEFVFETLKDTLKKGDKIKISGFGNFMTFFISQLRSSGKLCIISCILSNVNKACSVVSAVCSVEYLFVSICFRCISI